MSSETPAASSSSSSDILINIKGPNAKLQVSISLDKTVAELKEAIAEADEKKETPAERQRLIYSGRVLKDEDTLSTYKIQAGHTVHLVKGAARPAGSSGSGTNSGAAPQQLPAMQAGQNPSDPLTILNGPMGHGAMAGFNPFADMGLNTNDPNMMTGMLDNPMFLQQMSNMMSNPAILDQIISSNPQLAAMGPQVRQMMQSEAFRNMISNPQSLQQMMRMNAMMREAGLGSGMGGSFGGGGFGGLGGGGAFPAPGMPSYQQPAQGQDQTSSTTPSATSTGTAAQSASPGTGTNTTGTGATGAASSNIGEGFSAGAANPFAALASLLGAAGVQGVGLPGSPPAGTGAGAAGTSGSPFGMVDPALVQQLLGGMGGSGGNPLSPFGGFGAGAAAAPPADTRSPEERFATQLAQMNEMGFIDARQNVRALLATNGNVNAAIEYILGGGGI